MKNKDKFYVTTTIPYANAPPHIGFALEIITADVLARWNQLRGKDVFFLTGTDEHGTKNYQTAKKQGMKTKEFVDKNSRFFKELTKKLNISNNYFIRTTDKKNHWPGVIDIWNKLAEKKDIYKKKYSGFYCPGCERFVTEKDLVGGKCPDHPKLKIEKISEENYFFRLSKYSDKIKKIIENDEYKISPTIWKNDFLGLVKEGLTDVSFSREKKHLLWGIPVPDDDNQVMYVWCEALGNYLTGIGYPDKKYKKYWPCDVHVVGKDMHRFHAGIWTGMLLSLGLPLPKELIVHGFLTVDGKKMSKSTGNVIAPLELLEKYEADTLRYYLIRTIPFGQDGDFSKEALIDRHNNELANKLGNLVSRVSGLIEKNGMEKCELITPNEKAIIEVLKGKINVSKKVEKKGSIVPAKTKKGYTGRISLWTDKFTVIDILRASDLNKNIPYLNYIGKVTSLIVEKHFENYEFDKILNEIFTFIDFCNEYVQNTKPWETRDMKVLYELADSIKVITILLYPFIPETSEKVAKQFGFLIKFSEIEKPIPENNNIKKGEILFKKI